MAIFVIAGSSTAWADHFLYNSFHPGYTNAAFNGTVFPAGAGAGHVDFVSSTAFNTSNEVARNFTLPGGPGISMNFLVDTSTGSLHAKTSGTTSFPGQAQGYTDSQFSDCLLVTSQTLPAGTPVQFQINVHLDYALTGTIPPNPPADTDAHVFTNWNFYPGSLNGVAGTSDAVSFSATETFGKPASPNAFSTIYNTSIGQLIGVEATLHTAVAAFNGAILSADASDAASFTFVPITPGAAYVTGNGVTYVPEPASLMGIGAAMVPFMRRRGRATRRS